MATTLKERLERALSETPGLSKAGLARACSVAQPSVSNWFDGRTKNLEGGNLLSAARYLGVTPEWLASGKPPMRPKTPGKPENGSAAERSQSARLVPAKIVSTTGALLTFLRRRDPAATLDLTDLGDAELFADTYAEAVTLPAEPSDADQQLFGARVASLVAAREARDERIRSKSASGDPGEEVRGSSSST